MSTDVFLRKPVSKQAARAIWKAPWWAHLNEAPQQAKKVMPQHEWTLIADLFSPPPEVNSIDRRGLHVEFLNNANRGVITGFHRRKKTRGSNHYYWWVICESGEITTLRWSSVGTGSRRFKVIE